MKGTNQPPPMTGKPLPPPNPPMRSAFVVKTSVHMDAGFVRQDLIHEVGDQQEKLGTWMLNTREETVRAALIKLGWTPPGQQWRHLNRGTLYNELCRAEIQNAAKAQLIEGDVLVVYRGVDGKCYAREVGEFNDGRFMPETP